jgi:long-chain acyl-CoA synthetase
MAQRLDQLIEQHATINPDGSSIGSEKGIYSYKELNGRINRLTNSFLDAGITQADRIGILLMNQEEFVFTYYACMRVGAVSVPMNPVLSSRELQVILSDCQPKIIVTNESLLGKISQLDLAFKPILLNVDDPHSFKAFLDSGNENAYISTNTPEEATIIYTSGTTGLPKGAILTHSNLLSNAETFAKTMSMNSQERTLIVAPVFHSAAQTCCLNATVCSGGYNYLLERWESSTKTLKTMEQEQISFFFGPPTMYTYMLQDPNLETYHLRLRIAFSGAAPLPIEIFNKWKELFGFEIVEGYGLSETSPVVTINPPQGLKKPGSIGIPIEHVQVKIMDQEGTELPDGQVGELVVKGPNVMKGYWQKHVETASVMHEDWFHTGDMGRKDEDGYFYIVDRKKDMINRAGFKVYPREVEEVIYQYPAILEVAVVGIPDPERGEEIKAFITLKDGHPAPTLYELQTFCKEYLASYKVPKILEILDQMPKTVSGKILKTKLRNIG